MSAIYNFSAGPSVLPKKVIQRAHKEFVNFQGCGSSVFEISHRSKEFISVIENATVLVKKLLNLSDAYEVLWLQGGASLQFSMAPINLMTKQKKCDLINTGAWTKKAIKEIQKVGEVNIIGTGEENNFSTIPDVKNLHYSEDVDFLYIASNNTIFGTQYHQFDFPTKVPIVADMSSDIFSKPLDVTPFGLIFAGAQKNIGPAGATLVIVRKDLLTNLGKEVPSMLQYKTHIDGNSLYNTPPSFSVYMCGLVLEWIEELGGLAKIEEMNRTKAKILYDAIDEDDYYRSPVNKPDRSLMNVIFRVKDDDALEKKFIAEATEAGLTTLKGHRSVGGLRASIYNAQPTEGVEALVAFMQKFKKENG